MLKDTIKVSFHTPIEKQPTKDGNRIVAVIDGKIFDSSRARLHYSGEEKYYGVRAALNLYEVTGGGYVLIATALDNSDSRFSEVSVKIGEKYQRHYFTKEQVYEDLCDKFGFTAERLIDEFNVSYW